MLSRRHVHYLLAKSISAYHFPLFFTAKIRIYTRGKHFMYSYPPNSIMVILIIKDFVFLTVRNSKEKLWNWTVKDMRLGNPLIFR